MKFGFKVGDIFESIDIKFNSFVMWRFKEERREEKG